MHKEKQQCPFAVMMGMRLVLRLHRAQQGLWVSPRITKPASFRAIERMSHVISYDALPQFLAELKRRAADVPRGSVRTK